MEFPSKELEEMDAVDDIFDMIFEMQDEDQ